MNKCWNCNVEILDNAPVCPLCKSITEYDNLEKTICLYPYAERGVRKIQMALRIYTFSALALELIALVVSHFAGWPVWWLIIMGAVLIYAFLTLKLYIMQQVR